VEVLTPNKGVFKKSVGARAIYRKMGVLVTGPLSWKGLRLLEGWRCGYGSKFGPRRLRDNGLLLHRRKMEKKCLAPAARSQYWAGESRPGFQEKRRNRIPSS